MLIFHSYVDVYQIYQRVSVCIICHVPHPQLPACR